MATCMLTIKIDDRVTACARYDNDCENVLKEAYHSYSGARPSRGAVLALGRWRGREYDAYRDFCEFMDEDAREAVDAAWEATGDEEAVAAAFTENMAARDWKTKRTTLRGGEQSQWVEVVIALADGAYIDAEALDLQACVFGPVYAIDYYIDGAYESTVGGVYVAAGDVPYGVVRRVALENRPHPAALEADGQQLIDIIKDYGAACLEAGDRGLGGVLAEAALDRVRALIGELAYTRVGA